MDFFEDQLVAKRYDWKALLEDYLYQGKEPLINGLVSGRESVIHIFVVYTNSKQLGILSSTLGMHMS